MTGTRLIAFRAPRHIARRLDKVTAVGLTTTAVIVAALDAYLPHPKKKEQADVPAHPLKAHPTTVAPERG